MYKNRESLIMYQDFDEYLDIVTFYKADLDCEHFCQRSCRTLVHGLPTKKVETVSLPECVWHFSKAWCRSPFTVKSVNLLN